MKLTYFIGLPFSSMLYLNWRITLGIFCLVPFFIFISLFFGKKIRIHSKISYENSARALDKLDELLYLIPLIRQFSRYKFPVCRYFKVAAEFLDQI